MGVIGNIGDAGRKVLSGGGSGSVDPNAGYLPHADSMYRRARLMMLQAGGRDAPMIAPAQQIGLGGSGRDVQMQVANRLLGIGSGQQMGAGELAVQRQGTRALAQNQAMARMARGSNAAIAGRDAARAAGEIGLQTAGQAQGAALNDQMAALGQAGQVGGQLRGQDIDVQGRNQAATNQRAIEQVRAQLAQTGMNDQAQVAYMAQMFGISQAEMQGLLSRESLRLGNAAPSIFPAVLQAAGTVGAGVAMGSDPELKRDTRRVSRQIDKMLDKLVPQAYAYKDPGKHGDGRRAGIMTSDLEKSEAGRRLIREKPDGKYVDVAAGLSAALASVARLNERVRKMEKGK